jgi:hypothetical protein
VNWGSRRIRFRAERLAWRFAGAVQRAGSRPGGRPNFCWAKSLDQKALLELSEQATAPISIEAGASPVRLEHSCP